MITFESLKLGDHVTVTAHGGRTRTGFITSLDEADRNQAATVCYQPENKADGYWCYVDQIRVVQSPRA